MKLILPWPPALNNLYATVGRRRVLSAKGRTFKHTAATIAYRAGMKPMSGEVAVLMKLYRPRRIGDVDAFFKVVLDSLKGIAWGDDAQVVKISAERFDDKSNPRVELEVLAVERGAEMFQEVPHA